MSSQKSTSFLEIAQKHEIPPYQIPTLQLLYETTREDTEYLHVLLDLLSPTAHNMIRSVIGAVSAGNLTDEKLYKNDLSYTQREIGH